MKDKKKIFRKMDALESVLFIIIFVYVLSMILVLALGVLNSLKTYDDSIYDGNFFGLPNPEYGWQFQYYTSELFSNFRVQVSGSSDYFYMWDMLLNSLLYSVAMSIVSVILPVMVAYACAKYDFVFGKVLYTTSIIVMLIPIVGALPSKLQLADVLMLRNSIIGSCIINCSYTGTYFLVFYASFKSLSWGYAEAAQIDGAGHFRTFWQIMLPLVMSSVFAVFVLQFINHYNDYLTPMIFVASKPTIAYGLFMFKSYPEREAATPLKLAASIVTCVPVIILFIIFRNKIMGRIAIGGIKG